jgi:hypothetical protein
MIPAHWEPHHRDEDGEVLGYLAPAEDGLCVPVTLFGHTLAEPGDADDARATLDSVGLSYLAERWLLTLPEREEPVTVNIVEASPSRVRVANVDPGYLEADHGHIWVLEVPVNGRLRPARS